MRELTGAASAARSLVKRFRGELWQPFIAACKRYRLVTAQDRIAAVLDGSSAACVACMLMLELHRHPDEPFSLTVLDAGADPALTAALEIPARPCGADPLRAAREAGANRVVLPDCMSDVTETVFGSMLCEGELRAFLPLETLPGEPPLAVIRPLYCVDRRDIVSWCRYNSLPFAPRPSDESRRKARALLDEMRRTSPNLEISVFRAVHQVHLDTFPDPESR